MKGLWKEKIGGYYKDNKRKKQSRKHTLKDNLKYILKNQKVQYETETFKSFIKKNIIYKNAYIYLITVNYNKKQKTLLCFFDLNEKPFLSIENMYEKNTALKINKLLKTNDFEIEKIKHTNLEIKIPKEILEKYSKKETIERIFQQEKMFVYKKPLDDYIQYQLYTNGYFWKKGERKLKKRKERRKIKQQLKEKYIGLKYFE